MKDRMFWIRIAVLACMVGLYNQVGFAESSPSASSRQEASHICDSYCESGRSCGDGCYPTQFDFDQDQNATSCGEYDGGYANGHCDYYSWDSCQACAQNGLYGETCFDGGVEKTCGSYGQYSYCGDDFCNDYDGEDVGSCPADCGDPSAADVSTYIDTWEDAAIDINNSLVNDNDADASMISSVLYGYGLIDSQTASDMVAYQDDHRPIEQLLGCRTAEDGKEVDAEGNALSGCADLMTDPCYNKALNKAVAGAAFAFVSAFFVVASAVAPPAAIIFAPSAAATGYIAAGFAGAAKDDLVKCVTGWEMPWNR